MVPGRVRQAGQGQTGHGEELHSLQETGPDPDDAHGAAGFQGDAEEVDRSVREEHEALMMPNVLASQCAAAEALGRRTIEPGTHMVTTIGEILPQAAHKHGDRDALIVDGRRLSFRQLDVLSNRVANGLVASGVQPGDRVSLFGPNSWEWLASYYGIAKTGAVINPLSSMLTADEVRYAVSDTGASAVIASPDKGNCFRDSRREAAGSASSCGTRCPSRARHCSATGWTARAPSSSLVCDCPRIS